MVPGPQRLLGLAAIQDIDNRSTSSRAGSCGLIKWCYSMSHLALAPYLVGRAELVVLTNDENNVRSLCASAATRLLNVLPLDETLERLIRNWTLMLNYSTFQWTRQVSVHALYKLQLFRLTQYRAILFTDVDVDLFLGSSGRPPSSLHGRLRNKKMGRDIEQAWTKSFTIFLNSTVRLLASADQHSPINTGVMLLKPSLSIFEQAVRVLRRRRFDPLLGFDWVGRPRDALRHLRVMKEWDIINRTTMMRENDWNFVGGHACQGLFVYLFLVPSEVHSPVFAFPKNRTFRHEHNLGAMRARHFNAGHKPWKGNVRCPTYFKFLEHADVDAGQEDHFCWQLFRRKNRCLQERLNRATCAECRFNFNLVSSCTGKPEKCSGTDVMVLP